MPPSEPLLSEQAAFAKHLFTQGYPLWSPDPVLLPQVNQNIGLQIGDVGVIDERGRFDLFFNILHFPPENSEGPSPTFPPIIEDDTRRVDEDILPREVISSPSTLWEVDQIDVSNISGITRRTTQYGATLSNDGAHIVVPQGARCYEVGFPHKNLFENYAKEQGAKWIESFRGRLGQPRSPSLYLLTGFYRTRSWSLASFSTQNAANTDPVRVHCILAEVEEHLLQAESVWQPAGRFKRKIGPPPDRQGRDNQTIFIRGFTITPRGSEQEGERRQASLLGMLSTPAKFLTTLAGSSPREKEAGPSESNVTIQHVPQISHVAHPSEIINWYLLDKEPSAKIAVTHDRLWINLLGFIEEECRKLEDLEERLEELVLEHYSLETHSGAVYLKDKTHESLARFGIDRSCLPSDLASCITAGNNPFSYHTFANVYSGTLHTENLGRVKIAIKVFIRSSNEIRKSFEIAKRIQYLIKVWTRLDHINVMPVIGMTTSFLPFLSMVSPWAAQGTLSFYLESNNQLTDKQVLSLNHDVASGLHYLHLKGIVHGDLSCNNVLIDANGRALLADYGVSIMAVEFGWKTSGTGHGNDPGIPATKENDIFDFGYIILQTLLAGDLYYYYLLKQPDFSSMHDGLKKPDSRRVTDHRWSFIQRCRSEVSPIHLRPSSREIVDFTENELANEPEDSSSGEF